MNFQEITPVEDYNFYLDLAFRRSREKGKELRLNKLEGGRYDKSKYIEVLKMQVIADTISSRMESIVKSFPSFDNLAPFYQEMVRLHIDYVQLKKSLAALNWLSHKSKEMFKIYCSKLDKNHDFNQINILKKQYLGRMSSLIKQVKGDLEFLEQSRKIMKSFPVVKTSLRTIAIAGFPNVGKTTLLYNLTGSKGEINSYPFTTKGVNVGYIGKGKERLQLLDTPGALNRFEKMNYIEQVAYLAMKHCAEVIIYVYDLTEEYPIEDQEKLLKNIRELGKPIIRYVTKTDITPKEKLDAFLSRHKGILTSIDDLKAELEKIEQSSSNTSI